MSWTKSRGINPKPQKKKETLVACLERMFYAQMWDMPHCKEYDIKPSQLTVFEFLKHPNVQHLFENKQFMVVLQNYINKTNLLRFADFEYIKLFNTKYAGYPFVRYLFVICFVYIYICLLTEK